jgi:hypothetical protein
MNEQNTRSSEALDLATLDQLEKKAHPAPWFGEDITEDGLTVIDDGLTANDRLFPIKCEGHEAALIVALRNAAHALIARARRADELERSLQTKDAEIARLKDADVEHEASFDLRWKADLRAIERWRGARKDRELIWPDHADLCVNALDWVETAERALKDRDAEVERLKSAWQERENEALTLRAANADFARSFSDLQDELAAGRKSADAACTQCADAERALNTAYNELAAAQRDTARVVTLHLASEYHDDLGSVLWWHLPVCEPPEVGTSVEELPEGYPDGWHTHFSRMPIVWDGDGSALRLSAAARAQQSEVKP